MKYAFVLTDLSGGGAEKAVLNIAGHLLERGHSIDIILLRNNIDYPIHQSFNLITLAENPSFGWLAKKWLAYRLAKVIKRQEKVKPFDIIVSTLPLADEIALMARLPNHWCRIANTLSAEISKLAQKNASKSVRRYKRYQKRYNAKQLIAVSQGVKKDLQETFHLNNADIRVIYNPFDLEKMNKLANEPFKMPQQPYIIHAGRFSAQKRHDVLLESYAKIKNPHLLVLLTSKSEALDNMIVKNGLLDRVIVAGFQSNPYPWMAKADLLVLSSDHEGMPNVMLEALMVGTSVVSTDCPSGPREILDNLYSHCLVPIGDVKHLTKVIDWALENRLNMDDIDLSPYYLDKSIDAYEALPRSVN
ncbi:MAG: glycosyltransferase [Endozoicomonadaceae bacterium]|nr:glycosyltransferase [Endozoicomonadaceae bacterium]